VWIEAPLWFVAGHKEAPMTMKELLYLPPFGELSDPRLLADLASEAEAAGWDGIFLWDHVLRRREEAIDIADPWICLSAMAMRTSRLRLGPLVTPITRRRPIKLAREIVTLDHLSGGRLTMGFGLGVDSGGELSRFGEAVDPLERAARLDEGLAIIDSWLSTGHADVRGEHFSADDVFFGPRPVQLPRPPFWFAVRGTARRPARRAAAYEGLCPIEMELDAIKALLDIVHAERGSLDGFDVVVSDGGGGHGIAPSASEAEMERAGATWITRRVPIGATAAQVRALIRAR
jgi:alkanesulfonate monooxygenase SsuD/methylene tetrahydromethanopterin reductase-like flavin-dependent oxidoreductase (luciferase family)